MIPDIQTIDHLKHLAGLKAEEIDTLDKAERIVTESGNMTIDGQIDDYEWVGKGGETFFGYVKYTADVDENGDVITLNVLEGGVHDEMAAWGTSQDHIDYEIADMNKDINHYGNEAIIDDARYEWEQETGMFSGGPGDARVDGDHDSAMASAGMGTDEDYGYYGESAELRKFANIVKKVNEASEQIPHNCAVHVEHKEFGKGYCIREQHTLTDDGNVSHYNVRFRNHGIKEMVSVTDLNILKERAHTHNKNIKSTVKKMSEDTDMRKLSKIVTEGDKQREVLTEDGAKTDKQVVTESVKKKPETLKEYIERNKEYRR